MSGAVRCATLMTFTEMTLRYRNIGKTKKCTFMFCADHGVAKMNVSAYPQATTAGMVKNYLIDKGAAANAFANFANSDLVVVDVGVNADISNLPGLIDRKISNGTNDISEGAAMTLAQAKKSVKIGRDMVKKAVKAGYNCFLIGEMGIANTTVASAITAAILEVDPKKVTGRGSNISDTQFKNKLKIIRKALRVNNPNSEDAFDVLSKVGGFEFGAMAGVILEASKNNCITILDGFNSCAAALIADLIDPDSCENVIASHIGREIGHLEIIKYFGFTPMFTLDLALGEAVGSSIAARVLDNLVYSFICEPEDDFDGNLEDFQDEDSEETIISNFMNQLGLNEMSKIETFDELEDYLNENFEGDLQIEEVNVDFQLSDDLRFKPYEPPFSTQKFNIPRSYPIMIREMTPEQDEMIAATDKTFNFYLETMPKLNLNSMDECREYLDTLTKPKKSLGLLEDIAAQFAGISSLKKPSNKLRRAALAFTNSENSPSAQSRRKRHDYHNLPLNFSMTSRTFAMKVFLGVVDQKQNPTVAFNFGRTIGEEISFAIPIIAITELTDWARDRIDEKFAAALLNKDGSFKVSTEEFLNRVPKKFRCLTGAIIGAMVAAAHNSTLIIVDCGAVEIIARYLEKICPQIRPFILHSTELINFDFEPGERLGYDGETACIGTEIVEAALTALNEMKTFDETKVVAEIKRRSSAVKK